MRKVSLGILGIVLLLSALSTSCNKEISVITITELTGRGYYAEMTRLQFGVTLVSTNEVGATITNWVIQIKSADTLVIQVEKNVPSWIHEFVTPAPDSTYRIEGNGSFHFSCFYDKLVGATDIYAPYFPNIIVATVTIQDDNGNTYDITQTGTFGFYRI